MQEPTFQGTYTDDKGVSVDVYSDGSCYDSETGEQCETL